MDDAVRLEKEEEKENLPTVTIFKIDIDIIVPCLKNYFFFANKEQTILNI